MIPATGDRVLCLFVENQEVVGTDPDDPVEVSYGNQVDGYPIGSEHPELLKQQADRTSLWNIDFDWRFHLGDLNGAELPEYNSDNWRFTDLPHDWSIEGEYSPDNGTDWQTGFLPAGIGWYREKL